MGVDNLRVCHCSGSTLLNVMDCSNTVFHGLLIVYNQVLALKKKAFCEG